MKRQEAAIFGLTGEQLKKMTGIDPYEVYLALEKQKPLEPDFEADGYSDGELVYDTWICQNCESKFEVDFEKYDYCPNCGQRIDWGDDLAILYRSDILNENL